MLALMGSSPAMTWGARVGIFGAWYYAPIPRRQ
jgi:hypothetical protein